MLGVDSVSSVTWLVGTRDTNDQYIHFTIDVSSAEKTGISRFISNTASEPANIGKGTSFP